MKYIVHYFFKLLSFVGLMLFTPFVVTAQERIVENSTYKLIFMEDGVSSFSHSGDSINLIPTNAIWGEVKINYRVNKEGWNKLVTNFTRRSQMDKSTFMYTDSLFDMPLYMKRIYSLKEDGLYLNIEIGTTVNREVELGDVILPVRWNKPGGGHKNPNPVDIFEGGFIQKHSISVNSSFLSFSKPSGNGPFYMMLAGEGTPIEYFDNTNDVYKVFVHSAATGSETEGSWRIPHTSKILKPVGSPGSSVTYDFKLIAVPDYNDLREAVYHNGLLDVRASPGYTVPRDLTVRVAIRIKGTIDKIVPEFPKETHIVPKGKGPNGYWLYDVQFDRLGENLLQVQYNNDETTVLEFFSTEPIETLIKKRSAFIVHKQQHKVPGKWWDGLYSVYDMKYNKLRSPEDTDGYDGWWGYVIACDDPILGKAPFVAAKNVVYPDSLEIASLEYYLENFVWGKLQRSDEENPYPYGVYGVPNWYVSRDSALHAMVFPNDDKDMQIWRAYDYPHLIKLYYHMYQISQISPQWVNYLSSEDYLERAAQTAVAYFKYPYKIWSWFDTYKWGIYNEWIILEVISELEKRGNQLDADFLRGEWEKKAKYFIYDDKYPYRSEHSFDRTAFESSYALAKYAVENPMKPDEKLWYDKNKEKWYSHPKVSVDDAKSFMDQQHNAGLAVRGWLMPKYYLAGADCGSHLHTHDMSYMSMMGGWSILDYGLFYSKNTDWLELGYNSYLSSWALMNTGDEKSNYGFWYPGKERDGASGWAFVSAKNGMTWINKQENRGVWRYDGEIDLGYGAAFHTARTIVAKDSVFGLHAYGGNLKEGKSEITVVPKDGVRQSFSYVIPKSRFHLTLNRDGFLANTPIQISLNGSTLEFTLENRTPQVSGKEDDNFSHNTRLEIRSENIQPKQIIVSGKSIPFIKNKVGWEAQIPVSNIQETVKVVWK